jgi:hypothetical protein
MNLSVLLAPLFVCPAVNPPFTFQSSFLPIFTQTNLFDEVDEKVPRRILRVQEGQQFDSLRARILRVRLRLMVDILAFTVTLCP